MLDPSPIFREFVKDKLATAKVSVEIARGRRDAFTRLLSLLPDLIIIDVEQGFASTVEFLERKRTNPNAAPLPVIIVGPAISTERVVGLIRLGVVKYFARPFVMDIFIKTVGTFLSRQIEIDTSPCIIETHKNKSVLVVETSVGLNLDKIAMLKFNLTDLVTNHAITNPKILLIFSNLQLNFVDGVNLEKFFDNILLIPRITKKEVKVLSLDPYIKEFLDGHKEYAGIQVEDSLASIVNSFVESTTSASLPELITSKILRVDKHTLPPHAEMFFQADIESRKAEISQV